MKVVRLHDIGDLRLEEIPEPETPAADEVLVAIETAGICGSDIHNFRTGMWLTRRPSTPGHEICGTVLACGSGVDRLRTGDRVIADSRVFCGSCDRCSAGLPNLCRSIGYVGEVVDGGCAAFRDELHESNRLLSGLAPQLASLASPPVSLDEVPAAYERLASGTMGAVKVVVRPD